MSFLIIVSSGCKKNEAEKLRLFGTITDSSDGNPLSDVSIHFEAQLIEAGTFNNNFQSVASSTTDANGYFDFTVKREAFNSVRLTYEKDSYLQIIETINSDVLSPEGTDFSSQLDPVAYVELRLVNAFPANSSDEIEFRYTSAYFPQCACCNNSPRTFSGTSVDTTLNCSIVGNTMLTYAYFVTKNGFQSVFQDSVFVNSFETTSIQVDY